MNFLFKSHSFSCLAGILLIVLFTASAFSQQQRPRKAVQPVNLVYGLPLEGVSDSTQEAYIHSNDGVYIPAVVLKGPGSEEI